jgi:hypothetical protein
MIGVGIGVVNNTKVVSGVSYDADAQTYFNSVVAAGGSLSETEKGAANVYVLAMKSAGIWTSPLIADYPMLGGTSASQKINLKNPGTFDLIFVNTVAGDHTANGWLPNGTTSYARTGITPGTHISSANAFCVEFYSRTDIAGSVTFGCITTAGTQLLQGRVLGASSANPCLHDCFNSTVGRLLGGTVITSASSQIFDRISATEHRIFINGTSHITNATGGGTLPTHEIYVGGRNNAGTADAFDSKQCAGFGVYNGGLTQAQALAQYNARQAMNTTLSRQV